MISMRENRKGLDMNNIEKKVQKLLDGYDKRAKKIKEQYNRAYDSAMDATQVLKVQEWYAREEERLAKWYRKGFQKIDRLSRRG